MSKQQIRMVNCDGSPRSVIRPMGSKGFLFFEFRLEVTHVRISVKLVSQSTELSLQASRVKIQKMVQDKMNIDHAALVGLELLRDTRYLDPRNSLYGVLSPRCSSRAARRVRSLQNYESIRGMSSHQLLRRTITSPSTSVVEIDNRMVRRAFEIGRSLGERRNRTPWSGWVRGTRISQKS